MSSSNTTPQGSQSEMVNLLRSATPRKGFRTLSRAQLKAGLSRLKSKSEAEKQAQSNSTSSKESKPTGESESLLTRSTMWLKQLANVPASLHLKMASSLLKMRNKPLPILKHPDPRLKRIAEPVDFATTSEQEREAIVLKMGRALQNTDYGARLGLAAPQIGINKRVIIVRGNVMFNPTWTPSKAPPNLVTEGCYSVPRRLYKVSRAPYGWAKWTGIDGKQYEDKLKGIPAIVFQHEIDHLDGKCCADVGEELPEPIKKPE